MGIAVACPDGSCSGRPCADGLVCGWDLCVKPIEVGGIACMYGPNSPCVAGAFCDMSGGSDGKCIDKLAAGEECENDGQCLSGSCSAPDPRKPDELICAETDFCSGFGY